MKAIINIGLHRDGRPTLRSVDVWLTLERAGLQVGRYDVLASGTEPTFAAYVSGAVLTRLFRASSQLDKDCIAVWLPEEQRGELIGPRAQAWGEFNPEFFLLPDGQRLSSTVATSYGHAMHDLTNDHAHFASLMDINGDARN